MVCLLVCALAMFVLNDSPSRIKCYVTCSVLHTMANGLASYHIRSRPSKTQSQATERSCNGNRRENITFSCTMSCPTCLQSGFDDFSFLSGIVYTRSR